MQKRYSKEFKKQTLLPSIILWLNPCHPAV